VLWCVVLTGNNQPGYLDDPTVPEGSNVPTYAACRLFINNERWAGESVCPRVHGDLPCLLYDTRQCSTLHHHTVSVIEKKFF
jgi:hypothetical protein